MIPKAELHVHIEGTAPPALIRRLAARNKVDLPTNLLTTNGEFHWTDFDHFLATYDAAAGVIRTPEDYRDIVYEYLVTCAETGVIYVELTASPDHAASVGISDADHVTAIAQGIDDARAETGIEARILMICVRQYGPEQAAAVAKRVVDHWHPYVTGFGMAGDEARFPASQFKDAFAIAADADLGTTVHAGEWAGPQSVREALSLPGVTRIGHGVRAIEDPQLVTEIIERSIVLECCPTSNVVLGVYPSLDAHPFGQLRAAGVKVTLNSDDPPYWGTTIADEYEIAASVFDLTPEDLHEITSVAVEAAFVDERTKQLLRNRGQVLT